MLHCAKPAPTHRLQHTHTHTYTATFLYGYSHMNRLNHFFALSPHKEIYAALLCTLLSKSAARRLLYTVGVLSIYWGVYLFFSFTTFGININSRMCLWIIHIYLFIFSYIFIYFINIEIGIFSSMNSSFNHSLCPLRHIQGIQHSVMPAFRCQFACSTFLHVVNIFSGEYSNIFYTLPAPSYNALTSAPAPSPTALLFWESVLTYMYFLCLPRPLDTMLSNFVLSLFIIKIRLTIFERIFLTFSLLFSPFCWWFLALCQVELTVATIVIVVAVVAVAVRKVS